MSLIVVRLSVWCGIHGDVLVGPIFLNKLTAELYRKNLGITLLPYLDDLPKVKRLGFLVQ